MIFRLPSSLPVTTLIFRLPHQALSFRMKIVLVGLLLNTCISFKTWGADGVGLEDGGGTGISMKSY